MVVVVVWLDLLVLPAYLSRPWLDFDLITRTYVYSFLLLLSLTHPYTRSLTYPVLTYPHIHLPPQSLNSPPIDGRDDVLDFDDDDEALASVVSRLSLPSIRSHTTHTHNQNTDTFTTDHGFQPIQLPKKFAHSRNHHTPAKGKPVPSSVARAVESSAHTKNSPSPGRSGKASTFGPSGSPCAVTYLFDTHLEIPTVRYPLSLVRPLTHPLIHLFTHPLIHLFTHPIIRLFTHPIIRLFTPPQVRLLLQDGPPPAPTATLDTALRWPLSQVTNHPW